MINKKLSEASRQNKVKEMKKQLDEIVNEYEVKLKAMEDSLAKGSDNNDMNDTGFIDLLNKMIKDKMKVEEKMLAAKIDLVKNIKLEELIKIYMESEKVDK